MTLRLGQREEGGREICENLLNSFLIMHVDGAGSRGQRRCQCRVFGTPLPWPKPFVPASLSERAWASFFVTFLLIFLKTFTLQTRG